MYMRKVSQRCPPFLTLCHLPSFLPNSPFLFLITSFFPCPGFLWLLRLAFVEKLLAKGSLLLDSVGLTVWAMSESNNSEFTVSGTSWETRIRFSDVNFNLVCLLSCGETEHGLSLRFLPLGRKRWFTEWLPATDIHELVHRKFFAKNSLQLLIGEFNKFA